MALQEEFEHQGVWLFRYRSVLPIIVLFLGWGIYLYAESNPQYFFLKNDFQQYTYEYICLAVSLFGLLIRVYTVGHTPKNTSGRNVKEQLADTLNTSGIYSTVRHPLYVGNFFMWLGPALLSGNIWFNVAFILFYWVYYERIMFAEEQFLRRKFGDIYLLWAEKTPAFIPSFKNFVKPNERFSIKKVLKKEKNGLAAVFIIFSLFDVSAELLAGTNNFNYYFIAGCAATVLLYIVLKILKTQTKVLNEDGR